MSEGKRIRRRTPFRASIDRLNIYNRMRQAGFPPEVANRITLQVSRGVWSLKGGEVLGAGDRPVLYFPTSKEKVNV